MLTVNFSSDVQLPQAGSAVLLVAADRKLTETGQSVDSQTQGTLHRAMTNSCFEGKTATTLMILAPGGVPTNRILLVGVGEPDKLSVACAQKIGGAIVKAFHNTGETEVSVIAEEFADSGLACSELASHVAFGARLGSYRFDRYKTKPDPKDKATLATVNVLCRHAPTSQTLYGSLEAIADGVSLTRDLASEPANILTPAELAQRCLPLRDHQIEVEIFEPDQLRELKMGALLAVGQGSNNTPRVVVMRYHGAAADGDQQPVAFVGKGVTFDTGGYSLKPPKAMEDMKMDMCGAAIVIGTMRALAGRRAKVNAVGVVGLVENMISGGAMRPSDIITSRSGQTIEVLNTDAEGRLVLADLLDYTETVVKPRVMINLATLTGAIVVALGSQYAGLFSNNNELADRLVKTGSPIKERLWRMPLDPDYDEMINSKIADMKNISGTGQAGSITAAQFLQRFVDKVPWAHVDVAGVSIPPDMQSNGFGVQLLSNLVAEHYE